jgi:hypothetical protein
VGVKTETCIYVYVHACMHACRYIHIYVCMHVKLECLEVSPPTRSRRSIGSGGEISSMLTSMEGNAVQVFLKGNNFLP